MLKIYDVEDLFDSKRNIKLQGLLNIPDTGMNLPFTRISGSTYGKTVLITAGIHGCEYVGIETSKRLARIIDPAKVSGNIIIIHTVNCSGFRERLAGVTAEDGENLNRVFPGDKNGKPSEKLAYFILNYLSKPSDFYIDMHGADLHEAIKPLIFYPTAVDKEVSEISRRAAEASGFPYLVASVSKSGSYSSAASAGTPGILTELGGMGLWNKEEVNSYTEKILRILNHLEVYKTDNKFDSDSQTTYFNPVNEFEAAEEGFWYPSFKVGDRVAQGTKIGEIRDVFDNLLEEYFSPVDGIILYQTVALSVKKGKFLFAISSVKDN
ncbi:succinylglutamate desuccinylase/aspartoacylase family protein [Tissierella sp. Yu-01]|uniref:succinylglutamate desuccinylase/aspartoacylase domain-containing protein n=1 Tax=Tissierella sp. Yu-01 TaxID=3035694 RepID=UPI00240D33D2|nr:succinylglutamate desuccinylase/aspartoacylase family protein [Tissierella sp. Yu-01]WFA09304.1 succinylglutamate desuccinylase/aspartoacylase family protein [Tissierella sp. Yu-01]